MPPQQQSEQYTKRVEFKAADGDRQVATGVVMVPNKVDLQGDYVREETIREFAEDYMARYGAGETAEQGVMHAVWPDDHITLVENKILEQDREIGGETVPAGSWVQSFKFEDDELWSLVDDGVLSGYSIGAREVEWSDPVDQDDLPEDVDVAADYPDDEPAYELEDGRVIENSTVDIPAVPDAQILATKDDSEKRLADHLGDREAFIEEAKERGHSEEAASRLWSYLQRAAEEGETELEADAPSGVLQRVGKAAISAFTGSDDGAGEDKSPEAPDDESDKESRTLSQQNRERLMAAHDAIEDALGSELDFPQNRFTDNPATDFDVADFGKSADTGDVETPDDGGSKAADHDMTDTDDPMEGAPEWAKALHDDIEENSKRIEEMASEDSGEKGATSADDEEKDAWDEAPEWAKELKEQTEKNSQRIDDVATASGASQQIDDGKRAGVTTDRVSKEWTDTLGLPSGGDA